MYVFLWSESMTSQRNLALHAASIDEVKKLLVKYKFDLEFIDFRHMRELECGKGAYYVNSAGSYVQIYKLNTRDVFMDIYRDENFNEEGITPDDRAEVFSGIMLGSSDFNAEEMNQMLSNYNVTDIQAVDITEEYPRFCARLDNLREMSKEYHDKGDLKH